MAKLSKTTEGATQIEMPSGRHPESHFETHRISLEKAATGEFLAERHKRLKKKFEGMRHMDGGWRDSEKPEVIGTEHPMHKHLAKMFSGKPMTEANESASEEASEGASGEKDGDE